ncbi:peptidase family M28-domain-containing protein [Trichophaea hybrida]|nr:peptidase family M28-domain-containing protein [Trichophaea hybrida]
MWALTSPPYRTLPFICLQTLLLTTSFASAFTALSTSALQLIPRPSDADFNITSGTILSPILIPRVPGTEGSLEVLRHFQNFFSNNLPDWKLTTQNSSQTTPLSKGKKIPFVNFVATKDPPWTKPGDVGRLTLVAHYDSKITPKGFIGATDSAAPCAIILQAVRAIDKALDKKWAKIKKEEDEMAMEEEVGIMVLMLDGEEAWESWTVSDSLYGARDLAAHWEQLYHPPLSARKNHLSNIDLFVLLDLLGSAGPRIPSYFPTTHWAYQAFATIETQLRTAGLLASHKKSPDVWFHEADKNKDSYWRGGGIQDDHVPFMDRGVEVLHLIPSPFPSVWHTMSDDGKHLDMDTVKDWGTLLTAWMVGAMGLEKTLGDKSKRGG